MEDTFVEVLSDIWPDIYVVDGSDVFMVACLLPARIRLDGKGTTDTAELLFLDNRRTKPRPCVRPGPGSEVQS